MLSLAILTDESGDAAALGKAAQNPIADMISLPLQNNTNFDTGPIEKTQNFLIIQPGNHRTSRTEGK
jgi:hypothetical protein